MSEQIKDGGPVFPIAPFTQPNGEFAWGSDGMTVRDYFAITLLARDATHPGEGCDGYMEQRARVAYAYADAMLQARVVSAETHQT